MRSDLVDLKISDRELEAFTGFVVDRCFIGGLWGGTYRPSLYRSSLNLCSFVLTELCVFGLFLVLALPLSLAIFRQATISVDQPAALLPFLQVTLSLGLLLFLAWNLWMIRKNYQLQTLLHLLDEVDRFHALLQTIAAIDRLTIASNGAIAESQRVEIGKALELTRNSLVASLMTEKVLRENQHLLSRSHDLFNQIEMNLVALKTLEISDRAQEHCKILHEALAIGLSVHQEVQKFSGLPSSTH